MIKKSPKNWVIFFGTIIGFTFAAEWAVRLCAPQALIHALFRHDPVIEKRSIPFSRTTFTRQDGERHEITLNSDGFRMNQDTSQSIDRKRVLVYGGSAVFASHLPLELSIFGLLKTLIETKNRRFQLLNAAIPDHEVRRTRLLMKEQIPKYRPSALIYIFDASSFSRSLILGDRSEINQLRYDKSGQPKLTDRPSSRHFKYLNTFRTAFDWFHRHSHLITLVTRYVNRAIALARVSISNEPIEVQLSELPHFAQESSDIHESLYLSELHFQQMVQMTKAADIPFLVIWLPAPSELGSNVQDSVLAKILSTHRKMLKRLAAEHSKFEFWDSFNNIGEKLNADHIFLSKGLNNYHLSAKGSRWFAKKITPGINSFLMATLKDHI